MLREVWTGWGWGLGGSHWIEGLFQVDFLFRYFHQFRFDEPFWYLWFNWSVWSPIHWVWLINTPCATIQTYISALIGRLVNRSRLCLIGPRYMWGRSRWLFGGGSSWAFRTHWWRWCLPDRSSPAVSGASGADGPSLFVWCLGYIGNGPHR